MDNLSYSPEISAALGGSQDSSDQGLSYSPEIQAAMGGSILNSPTSITQDFGTVNPIEPTAGHRAGDTNYAAKMGDPVSVPPGQWHVVKAYNQAPATGAPGDYTNQGYGNDVILQNAKTGEKLHFLHLSGVDANPGDIVEGGSIVGKVGDSGNSTGENLGVEYYDPSGNLSDFEQSPYAKYLQRK